MLRKTMTLGIIALALLIVPLMTACSTDVNPTSTVTSTSFVAAPESSGITVSGAWARPAAMITSEGDSMSGMDVGDDSMAMSDDKTATPGMDEGDEPMAMEGHQPQGGTGAIYFTLTNTSDMDDTLVEVLDLKVETIGDLSDITELHETLMNDGVMKMQKLEAGMKVPAGESVELKPGGLHVMLLNMKRSLVPGDEITLRLRFDSGFEQTIVAEVREP